MLKEAISRHVLDDDVIKPVEGRKGQVPGPSVDPATDEPYRIQEIRRTFIPGVVLVVLVIVVIVAWWSLRDTGEDLQPLDDIDASDNFNLLGYYVEDLVAYGPYAHAVNLTLARGDRLVLEYTSSGPPGGVQVRLQARQDPSDGVDGAGGAQVVASSVGERGKIELRVEEGGAFQLYFWHPGSARPPGPDDDPDGHVTAAVSYDLRVERAIRA